MIDLIVSVSEKCTPLRVIRYVSFYYINSNFERMYIFNNRFVGKDGAGDVECRFVYSPHRSNADIQFIQNGRIVCSAKTVDSTHLPLSYQVKLASCVSNTHPDKLKLSDFFV